MVAAEGPPLHLSVEYEKDGKTVNYPAARWLISVKTKKSPPAFTWVYTGSRMMPDGKFAADVTGYVVSIVNFDLTLIDVPELVSSANETLEWQRNAALMPKTGTKVWMIIEAVGGKDANAPAPAKRRPPSLNQPSRNRPRLCGMGTCNWLRTRPPPAGPFAPIRPLRRPLRPPLPLRRINIFPTCISIRSRWTIWKNIGSRKYRRTPRHCARPPRPITR